MAKSYFKNIPNFEYVSRIATAKNISDTIIVKNLFKRGKIREDILNELFLDPVDLREYAKKELLSLKQREQIKGYVVDHGIDTIGDERD